MIQLINENMCDELAAVEADKLSFNFHYFLSKSPTAQSGVTRYARDTPLHMSVRKNQLAMVEILIAKGINVSFKIVKNKTPIFHNFSTRPLHGYFVNVV